MWHSHQACSGVYRDDTIKLLGRVLSHDDTDSDRAEGQKLDTGFNKTRELWHHTFGSSYEKAGAMYRGEPPRLPSLSQWTHEVQCWPKSQPTRTSFKPIQGVEPRKTIQVCIGVFEARNLHIDHDGVVAVRLLFKRKCSMLKLETSWLKWADNTKWNQFWSFDCEESTEGLRLELFLENKRGCGPFKKSGLIGWTDILWKTLLNSSTLSFNGWMPLVMKSYVERDQKPAFLKVCISITPPSAAPYLFQMDHPLLKNKGRNSFSKLVHDHRLRKSFIAEFKDSLVGETWRPSFIQIYGADPDKSSGNLLGSAACVGAAMTMWSLLDGDMHLSISPTWKTHPPGIQLITASTDSAMLLHGRKYQYEVPVSRRNDDAGYMTLVRRGQGAFGGKATALFNWKSGAMEISPDESAVLVILLCAIMAMVGDKSHFMFCNRKPLHKLKVANNQDDWGAVMLNNRGEVHDKDLLWFCPWYTMSSKTWVGNLYKADRGFSSLFKLCCGFGSSVGCEGCGECLNGKSKQFDCFLEKSKHETVHGEHCTGWSEVNHEGCSTVSFVHSIMSAGKKMVVHGGKYGACGAGECGACGAGGCGNSRNKANVVAHSGGCGACGAGGCGNSINKSNVVAHAGGCGACGAGGCGNDIDKSNVAVHAGGCGSCGAGECGNKISKANVVAGGCGACGAGGCSNNVRKANAVAGGCGACGAGGCGNSLECHTPAS